MAETMLIYMYANEAEKRLAPAPLWEGRKSRGMAQRRHLFSGSFQKVGSYRQKVAFTGLVIHLGLAKKKSEASLP